MSGSKRSSSRRVPRLNDDPAPARDEPRARQHAPPEQELVLVDGVLAPRVALGEEEHLQFDAVRRRERVEERDPVRRRDLGEQRDPHSSFSARLAGACVGAAIPAAASRSEDA